MEPGNPGDSPQGESQRDSRPTRPQGRVLDDRLWELIPYKFYSLDLSSGSQPGTREVIFCLIVRLLRKVLQV